MAASVDKKTECGKTPTLGTSSFATIEEPSLIDSEVQTSKGKTFWEKSPEEVEDEVETIIQSCGDKCPERKWRHDEFNKEWNEDEESLDKKHTC